MRTRKRRPYAPYGHAGHEDSPMEGLLADAASTPTAPDTTTDATPGVRATAASLEPSLPAPRFVIPICYEELCEAAEAAGVIRWGA